MAPHGTPDWGLVGPKNVIYGLDDLGEHAVRVGSPHLWDRRGDALYLSDFGNGLGMFHTQAVGFGAAVNLVTGHSRQGAFSACLRAANDGIGYAAINLALPFQLPTCVGLEFSFAVAEHTQRVQNQILWYDGTLEHWGIVIYDHVLTQLSYYNDLGGYTVLDANVDLHECTRPEHTMKLVVDMTTGYYVRLMLDDHTYNMSRFLVFQPGGGTLPYWLFRITHVGVAPNTPDCYIDNVVVTQNEP